MQYILQRHIYIGNLPGYKWLGFFKTVPETTPEYFTAYQLLVAGQAEEPAGEPGPPEA